MKALRLRLRVGLSVALLSIGAASPALALANRVFVSARSGNNANACDNVNTPCQTLAGAVTQLNPDGEVIVLDTGGYGPVTITQGVTIEAPAGVTAFIHPPSGDAITISAPGAKVTLRGLVLNVGATNNGITVNSVGRLTVENCVINGFNIGINVLGPGVLVVRDSILRNNFYVGIFVDVPASGSSSTVERCRFDNNQYGYVVREGSTGSIRDSMLTSGDFGIGVRSSVAGAFATMTVENCFVTNMSSQGIYSRTQVEATMTVSNTTVTKCFHGFDNQGANFRSYRNNHLHDNGMDTFGTITAIAAQ